MSPAHNLRTRIEAALSDKIPGALSPAHRVASSLTATAIRQIDDLLRGGIPCGVITELVGPVSSGRTTVALAFLATVIKAGSVSAWVDASDALDPETAAANGVDLEHLLWVRCGAPLLQTAIALGVSAAPPTTSPATQPRHTGGGSPHPRSEGRNMPEAIQTLLQAHGDIYDGQLRREKKAIGTPGAPNRPLLPRPIVREEQVNSDRLPPRRGDNLAIAPRCAEPQPRRTPQLSPSDRMPVQRVSAQDALRAGISVASAWPALGWTALDQAIRATDLLLQGGGFGAIVLDLGSTPAEIAWRIPLATWFRFRAACERTRTPLLLLTQHPCARSSAELVLRLEAGGMETQSRVMTGIRYRAAIERSRSEETAARIIPIRKPPQTERPGQWTSRAEWRVSG